MMVFSPILLFPPFDLDALPDKSFVVVSSGVYVMGAESSSACVMGAESSGVYVVAAIASDAVPLAVVDKADAVPPSIV